MNVSPSILPLFVTSPTNYLLVVPTPSSTEEHGIPNDSSSDLGSDLDLIEDLSSGMLSIDVSLDGLLLYRIVRFRWKWSNAP